MAAAYSQILNKHGDQVYRKEMYGVEIVFADRKNSNRGSLGGFLKCLPPLVVIELWI